MAVPAPQRLKSAVIGLSEYHNQRTFSKFGEISAHILRTDEKELGYSKEDISPLSLSRLTSEILRYLDTYFGFQSARNFRRIGKLPIRLFQDYSVGGSLHTILDVVLRHARSLRNADFSRRREELVDTFLSVEKELRQKDFIQEIKIFCADGVARKTVEPIAKKRGFSMASLDESTHIIYPDPPGTTLADTQGMEYCRSLRVDGSMALVHWWYYPDSYDTWIPESEVQGETEEDEDHVGAWHVQLRWLQDTDRFNERMNETDYEIPEEGRTAVDTHASNASEMQPHLKRVREPNGEAADGEQSKVSKQETNEDGARAPSGVLKVRVKMPRASVLEEATQPPKETDETVNIESKVDSKEDDGNQLSLEKHPHHLVDIVKGALLPPESTVPRAKNISLMTPVRRQSAPFSGRRQGGADPTVSPAARWFSMDNIHRIEKRALPDFFTGHYALKTPRLYKLIRNKIVESWRASAARYLHPSSVKMEMDVDLGAVVRVHNFLEQWGIINFGLRNSLCLGAAIRKVFDGMFLSTADVSTKLFSGRHYVGQINHFYPAPGVGKTVGGAARCWSCQKDLASRCMRCKAVQAELFVCFRCFAEGKLPYLISARDFRPYDANDGNTNWSEVEILKLLEAVTNHPQDWEKVAAHVGTRDSTSCLLFFAKMPLEETLFDFVKARRAEKRPKTLSDKDIPLSSSKNPLMSQIAFLSAFLSPDLAAAAAQSAAAHLGKRISESEPDGECIANREYDKLCKMSLDAAAARAKLLAEVERREADRFKIMATETRQRELDLKLLRLNAVDSFVQTLASDNGPRLL